MSMDSRTPRVSPHVPSVEQLVELAERCEREAPNLMLRCDIAKALGWREVAHDCHIRMVDPDGRMWWATGVPDWPGSLDAAVTLVPSNISYELAFSAAGKGALRRARLWDWRRGPLAIDPGNSWEATGKTVALALCAAALRARAEQTQAPEPRGDAHPNHGAP